MDSKKPESGPLMRVESLVKHYGASGGLLSRGKRKVLAVNGVSLRLNRGETLGLVGESGCGKSTLGRCLIRLEEPTSGKIWFGDRELTALGRKELKGFRRQAQMIFQDPRGSLNPKMNVGQIVTEGVVIHKLAAKQDLNRVAGELLARVGLGADAATRFPHEFSGGQRQRIGIARALAVKPSLIIADEPTSALDVSIQAQIVNLLLELQQELGLTYLFITHDLRLVEFFAHRLAVMYLGRIVELADNASLFAAPKHPYTRVLLDATPVLDPTQRRKRESPSSEQPSGGLELPTGCPFHPRCSLKEARCEQELPLLRQVGEGHEVACHLAD